MEVKSGIQSHGVNNHANPIGANYRDMDTRKITIRVDAEAAKVYASASVEEREKIDLLLSLRLSQITEPSTSLEQVTRETSEAARARGLMETELTELFCL